VGNLIANNWCKLIANHLFKHFRNCGQDGNSMKTRNIVFFNIFKNWVDERLFQIGGKTPEDKDQVEQKLQRDLNNWDQYG
jgi:hypothetical protein